MCWLGGLKEKKGTPDAKSTAGRQSSVKYPIAMSSSWGRLMLFQVGDRVTSNTCYGIWEAYALGVGKYLFSNQTLSVPRPSQRLRLLAPFLLTCSFAAYLDFEAEKNGVCLPCYVNTLALKRALDKDKRKQSRD